ncbi:MAG: hypothetical protein QOG54_2022 [Actinomycetota bacterium]|jgi:hypothetical protein|nr:hypothetical protein [Actinomycetota bacterium]
MRLTKVLAALALLGATLVTTAPSAEAIDSKCDPTDTGYTCTYGPFTLDERMNVFFGVVESIPEAGYITSARATLLDHQGDPLSHHMAHLHHAVWLNADRNDLTCPSLPDRFFATGKERTKMQLPEGYGYYWSHETSQNFPQAGTDWVFNAHIDNMHSEVGHIMDVYVKLDVGFVPAAEGELIDTTPAWFDISNCTNDSEFRVPAGEGRFKRTWSIGMLRSGHFIAMYGHLHDQGVKLILRNETTGSDIFTSRALYESKKEPGYLTSMTGYSTLPGVSVSAGDNMKLTAIYKKGKKPVTDAMGIMLGAFVADQP